jgi:hypothetical protein
MNSFIKRLANDEAVAYASQLSTLELQVIASQTYVMVSQMASFSAGARGMKIG